MNLPKLIFLVAVAALPLSASAQKPTPAPAVEKPFRFNFQVRYRGAKDHPDLASFIYKSLRALPGVGIVDKDPDAILIINEQIAGSQYACSVTILEPAESSTRFVLETALSSYDNEQDQRRLNGEGPGFGPEHHASTARPLIQTALRDLHPMYNYVGGTVMCNPSAKVALSAVVKSIDVEYVEKQRRQYDYDLAHPLVLPPFDPNMAIPTATPYPAQTP